jgi:hypothetical protein
MSAVSRIRHNLFRKHDADFIVTYSGLFKVESVIIPY